MLSVSVRYKPEMSILKFRAGGETGLDADGFARLSAAFFDDVEKKFRDRSRG